MPTYEYKCDHCGQQFERQQAMSDPPVKVCPECGKGVRRVFSPFLSLVKGEREASPSCESCESKCGESEACESCPSLDE
jgi:putative FmdB family regulatory protein